MENFVRWAGALLLLSTAACTGALNDLIPDAGHGGSTGSTGSTSSSSSGTVTPGFSLPSDGIGGAGILLGIEAFPGIPFITPGDAGSVATLPIPTTLSYSGSEPMGGGPVSATLSVTQSGNVLTVAETASATSNTMDLASVIQVNMSYVVCFASAGATSVDFTFAGTGPGSLGTGVFDSVATISAGAMTPVGNAAGATDTGSTPPTGWSPASFTDANLPVIDGRACDPGYAFGELAEGGEINGEGKTGSSSVNATFTVTATPH